MKAIIMSGYGINCESETQRALELAEIESKIVHINEIIKNPEMLDNYGLMVFPGGFSYGDHTGAGNAFANKIISHLHDEIIEFSKEKYILGICNGFQIMTRLGLFYHEGKLGTPVNALMHNTQHTYECRWVRVRADECAFTKDIDTLRLPIAHGEGKFYAPDLSKVKVVLRYVKEDGSPAEEYPDNPNGSMDNIAAISNKKGNVMGMMPHPERAICMGHLDVLKLFTGLV